MHAKSENVIESKLINQRLFSIILSFLCNRCAGIPDWPDRRSKISPHRLHCSVEHFCTIVGVYRGNATAFVADLLAWPVEIIDVFLPQSFLASLPICPFASYMIAGREAFIGSLPQLSWNALWRIACAHFILKILWRFWTWSKNSWASALGVCLFFAALVIQSA